MKPSEEEAHASGQSSQLNLGTPWFSGVTGYATKLARCCPSPCLALPKQKSLGGGVTDLIRRTKKAFKLTWRGTARSIDGAGIGTAASAGSQTKARIARQPASCGTATAHPTACPSGFLRGEGPVSVATGWFLGAHFMTAALEYVCRSILASKDNHGTRKNTSGSSQSF